MRVASGAAAPPRHLKLVSAIAGHAGDSNFHCSVVLDASDSRERAAIEGFPDRRLGARALAMDDTSTGEHGVCVDVMRAIKQALDPLGILNPGKILPEPG